MRSYYKSGPPYSGELCHYGIKDMHWGIRRFQNPDGSYTPEGRKRYGIGDDDYSRSDSKAKQIAKKAAKATGKAVGKAAKATGRAVGSVARVTGRRIGVASKNVGRGIAGKAFKWAMTNEELEEYTYRLAVKANYKKVKSTNISKGREYVADLLREAGRKRLMNAIDERSARRRAALDLQNFKDRSEFQKQLDEKYDDYYKRREFDKKLDYEDYIKRKDYDTTSSYDDYIRRKAYDTNSAYADYIRRKDYDTRSAYDDYLKRKAYDLGDYYRRKEFETDEKLRYYRNTKSKPKPKPTSPISPGNYWPKP